MPKKTKKEKIIAEYRRKLQTVAVPVVRSDKNPSAGALNHSEPLTYRLSKMKEKAPVTQSSATVFLDDFPAIRRDLVKTVVFAIIAVIIEFSLYLKIGK